MNYPDESYVRLYTSDTATWSLLGWEGQTVLLHMLRGKFDRSGVFSCGRHEPSQAVTAVTRLPLAVVEIGLAAILREGVWILNAGQLVWPTYHYAQTCPRSDRLRQAESRKNRAIAAALPITPPANSLSQNVTECHELSQASQSVTLSLALPNRSEIPPPPSGVPPQGVDDASSGVFRAASEAPREKRPEKPKKRLTGYPDGLAPLERQRQKCADLRLDCAREFERFSAHHQAKGSLFADWSRAFDTWIGNALEFQRSSPRAAQRPRQPDEGYSAFAHAKEIR